jgi:hypothetical protein
MMVEFPIGQMVLTGIILCRSITLSLRARGCTRVTIAFRFASNRLNSSCQTSQPDAAVDRRGSKPLDKEAHLLGFADHTPR